MDLFGKCEAFYADAEYARGLGYPANPRMLEALGLYPYFIPIEASDGTEVTIDGRRLVMLGSNNYLGLTNDPRVQEAGAAAIRRYGTGCTGSRFLNGTLELHLELEDRLARFVGKAKALVFSTGFQTNLGVISAMMGGGDLVVCDRDVHASIVDGTRLARALKGSETRFFRHSDVAHLEAVLAGAPVEQAKLVVVDGVFSMGGDIAPLAEIALVCRRHNARLMVDDAHALGVLGGGRGSAAHFDCTADVDLIMGTFSKALGSVGGFVAASAPVIHWIQHFARSFMFSASLPPASVATVLAALDVIEAEPERVARVNRIGASMRRALREEGYDLGRSETPVVPVVIGDQFRAVQAWRTLFDAGIYTNVALPPAVLARGSLLRTSYMATHTEQQLDRVLATFRSVKHRVLGRAREPAAALIAT